MLVGIQFDFVDKVWNDVEPLLEKALDKSDKDYIAEDIKECLLNRDMQLWAWYDNGRIVAIAVTRIVIMPRRKICQLLFIGGSKMKDWMETEDLLASWARSNGCDTMEGWGRTGWIRALKNWINCGIILRRRV